MTAPGATGRTPSLDASRWAGLFALAVAATHVALKAPRLGSASLWLDEAVGVQISQLDFFSIIQASREDTTPPLYYLVLGGFERLFGMSEAAVRWPSVLASSATAAVLFLFARRQLGSFAAWLASALFLLSDVNLRYAREARPYALASLLCLLSFVLFFRALERPSIRAWAAVAAVNALMLFTHYATVFAVALQGLAILWPWRGWSALRRFGIGHALVAAVFLAWIIPLLSEGQHHKMDWLAAPHPGQIFSALGWFAGGHRGVPGFIVLLGAAAAGFAFARSHGRAVSSNLMVPLALWGLAPVFVAFGASYFVRCLHARYLLYATPGLFLFWAAGVQALPAARLRIIGAALACVVTGIGFGRSARSQVVDWRSAAEVARARPASRIFLLPSWELPSLAYYYDPPAFRDVAHTSTRLTVEGVRAFDQGAQIDSLDLDTARDVLIVTADSGERMHSIEQQLTEKGFAAVERHHFDGVTLARLNRSGGPWRSP